MKATIQQHLESFRKKVIPKSAPDIQIKEMKKAFYAGATSFYATQMEIADLNISEDTGVIMLQGLSEELSSFKDRVVSGQE